MAITKEDVFQDILESVGDVDPVTGDTPSDPAVGVIALGLPRWWALHASKDSTGAGLRAAYVRRDAIRRVLAVLAQKRFDVADNLSGLSIRAGQVYKHYQDMLVECLADIRAVESKTSVGGTPTAGRIAATLTPAPAEVTEEWMDYYRDLHAASLEE